MAQNNDFCASVQALSLHLQNTLCNIHVQNTT